MKFSRFFMIIPIIFFVIVFTMIIIGFNSTRKEFKENSHNNQDNNSNVEEMFDSILGEESKEQEKVTANFNEFAETKNYKVKVEK